MACLNKSEVAFYNCTWQPGRVYVTSFRSTQNWREGEKPASDFASFTRLSLRSLEHVWLKILGLKSSHDGRNSLLYELRRYLAPQRVLFSAVLAINRVSIKGFILIRLKRFQIYPCLPLSSSIASFFGNQHILNFEVMAVRDIMRRSLLSKNIHLSRDFWPF